VATSYPHRSTRIALFRYLHEDCFRGPTSTPKPSDCLLDLHERPFSGSPSFPAPAQVVHAIYDVMRAHPDLWSEGDNFREALAEMISTGRRRIRRADVRPRIGAGRQSALGSRAKSTPGSSPPGGSRRVTVDMPMGPLLVIGRFANLNRDINPAVRQIGCADATRA
jgi:hypothetical protein